MIRQTKNAPEYHCTECGHSFSLGFFKKIALDTQTRKASGPIHDIFPSSGIECPRCGSKRITKLVY